MSIHTSPMATANTKPGRFYAASQFAPDEWRIYWVDTAADTDGWLLGLTGPGAMEKATAIAMIMNAPAP